MFFKPNIIAICNPEYLIKKLFLNQMFEFNPLPLLPKVYCLDCPSNYKVTQGEGSMHGFSPKSYFFILQNCQRF